MSVCRAEGVPKSLPMLLVACESPYPQSGERRTGPTPPYGTLFEPIPQTDSMYTIDL